MALECSFSDYIPSSLEYDEGYDNKAKCKEVWRVMVESYN